jgi:hypothetical protein
LPARNDEQEGKQPLNISLALPLTFLARSASSLVGHRCKVAHKHFFKKSPQGFPEASVKEYKRAATAPQAIHRTLIAAPN